ncbi:MAG: hypothetical protein NBV68_13860 [Erythrobacter sp.]|uniref:hypothetical protein n=1 Tax=Erythrobacter sp. TaxID=1042 RepID=UPI0025F06C21|nr:hypothetical protein [Erythrobacter sp.]MCM0000465.1 hypothetical protein [Erythrobacter sp.]
MTRSLIAPALALTALASATSAQAQQQACVQPADLADAVVYAMPIAFDAARTACGDRFAASGFIAREGDAYISTFRGGQNKAWPGAFRFLKTFMNEGGAGQKGKDADMAAMIGALPKEALRPFVDALVGQMIASEIKPDSCGKIERGVELLSPLPGENLGGLIAFIVELTDMKNPPACSAAATVK